MRKLSEILKIGLEYYSPMTENREHSGYMCHALALANKDFKLTPQEVEAGQEFCMAVVDSLNARRVTLYAAVADQIDAGCQSIDNICCMIYMAMIDKLEEQELTN